MNVAAVLANKDSAVISVEMNGTTLALASMVLERNQIGAVIVTGGSDPVRGIFSERDLVRAVARHGPAVLSRPVSDFMTTDVVTCSPDDTLVSVMRKMTEGNFRHMPVMKDRELVSIISIRDVVNFRMVQAVAEAEAMRDYIACG